MQSLENLSNFSLDSQEKEELAKLLEEEGVKFDKSADMTVYKSQIDKWFKSTDKRGSLANNKDIVA